MYGHACMWIRVYVCVRMYNRVCGYMLVHSYGSAGGSNVLTRTHNLLNSVVTSTVINMTVICQTERECTVTEIESMYCEREYVLRERVCTARESMLCYREYVLLGRVCPVIESMLCYRKSIYC